MKTMFMGFTFVLVGLTMQLGVFIMAAQAPLLGAGSFSTAVDVLGLSSTLLTAHILTIGGLAIMLLEPAKDLIVRLINKRRPKE